MVSVLVTSIKCSRSVTATSVRAIAPAVLSKGTPGYHTRKMYQYRRLSIDSKMQFIPPIQTQRLDHVCVVSADVPASIRWYTAVLGMQHQFTHEPHFYPRCLDSPAFLQSGEAKLAILPVAATEIASFSRTSRRHFGEQFALTLCREEFRRAQRDLR